MSLACIHGNVRNKASNHAWLLLALLPCPKFLGSKQDLKKYSGLLEKRVLHKSLDIACLSLKIIAYQGRMFTDPRGYSRWCYTPLVAEVGDNPEILDLVGVSPSSSGPTIATSSQFGDPFRHTPRTAANTLGRLAILRERVDPNNLDLWMAASKAYGLNGVDEPFWRDWYGAEPSTFLPPEPLHQWMKQFWDHDMKWCLHAVGEAELNFRYSILQPQVGVRQFKEGVSGLKQVTGREHREIQKYLVACIADTVAPSFLIAIRARMDFFYMGQCEEPDDHIVNGIAASLNLFHLHKDAIIAAGARRGKAGPIKHWKIPKLELMQSVAPLIRELGSAIQYSADHTEKSHIKTVKEPFRESNHRDVDPQICRSMDREEKRRNFDLATSMKLEALERASAPTTVEQSSVHQGPTDGDNSDSDDDAIFYEPDIDSDLGLSQSYVAPATSNSAHPSTGQTLAPVPTPHTEYNAGPRRRVRDLFHDALCAKPTHRTFATPSTAFHLSNRPEYSRLTIAEAASIFKLPDLHPALADYVSRRTQAQQEPRTISGRRIGTNATSLPFKQLDIWTNVLVQTKPLYAQSDASRVHNVQARPPSGEWPYGYCDPVLLSTDPSVVWPGSGIRGKSYISHWLQILIEIHRPLCCTDPNHFSSCSARGKGAPMALSDVRSAL